MSDETPPSALTEQSLTLTTTLFSNLPPVLRRALELVAIPYWFDEQMLSALRGAEDADGRTAKILNWLSQRSFISQLPGGRYLMNPDMRGFIRARWMADRQGYLEANRCLAAYFAARIAQGPGPDTAELKQAHIYHLLGANGDAGLAELQKAFEAAESAHQLAVIERLVTVTAEQRPFLPDTHAAWIAYLDARSLQLRHRWAESCSRLQAMLDRPDLPADLVPHAQASLAAGLIETQHWSRASELYQQALETFEASRQLERAASCQLGLGYAHMDLGLNLWGQRESRPTPPPSLQRVLIDLVTFPARLPILLYLLFSARDPALLPAWLRLASGIDWTIARLFVQASRWYRRALTRMEATHDTEGILRAKDSLARLYLALGHPSGAASIYREVVDRTDIATSQYQMAHARAGLGLSLLRAGQAGQAAEALQAAALVLADYDDTLDAGRAYAALAEAQTIQGHASNALDSYSTALGLMQKADALKDATDVVHTLENIARRAAVPPETRAQAKQIASSVSTREYSTRYSHPALNVFRTVSVAVLAVTMFIVLYLAIRTESSLDVRSSAAMVAQALSEPSSSMSPVIVPSSDRTVVATFRASVAVNGILASMFGYLVTYTIVGLYVLSRTSLRQLERQGRRRDVRLDAEAISAGSDRVAFAEATGLVSQDWTFTGRTHPGGRLSPYSQIALLGPGGRRVTITGQTFWYWELTEEIARRLTPSARRINLNTTLLKSPTGILFIGSLVYLATFVALSYLWPKGLSTPILFGHYALADLRVVIYLGLLIPLVVWLVIAPLRAHLFLKPHSRVAWLVIGGGAALALASFLNLGRFDISLGRPDVIPGLLAVWLMCIGALAIYRARWHPLMQPERANAVAHPALARWSALVAALVALAIISPSIVNELRSYDALLAGNAARTRAEQIAQTQGMDKAWALYNKATKAYDLALKLNPRDVGALGGKGAVYVETGEWGRAIDVYSTSLQINPHQPEVWSNTGMALEGRAATLDDLLTIQSDTGDKLSTLQKKLAAYKEAAQAYSKALDLVNGNSARYLLQRGAVYSAIAQLYSSEDKLQMREYYTLALKDMEQALKLNPGSADAYNGIGWSHLKLAELAESSGDSDQALRDYELARDSFQAAVQLAHGNANAFNGLGWVWLKIGQLEDARRDPASAQQAYQQSLEAYERASQLESDDPQYMVSLGNAKWLVSIKSSACSKPSASPTERAEYIALIQSAITVMERGVVTATLNACKDLPATPTAQAACPAHLQNLSLRPSAAHYYRELGQLSYLLYTCKGSDAEERLRQAIVYYDKAITLEPSSAYYFQMRGRITYILGTQQAATTEGQTRRAELYQLAFQDLSSSLVIESDNRDSLTWRAFIGTAYARIQPDTPDGWARREEIEQTVIADRARMFELSPDDKTRADDARLLAIACMRLGWTYYLQGKYQPAIEAIDRGLAYYSDYPTLHFDKGLALLATGNEVEAQRSYIDGLDAVRKLPQPERAPFLDDALQDLEDLAKQKPELEATLDKLVQSLELAR